MDLKLDCHGPGNTDDFQWGCSEAVVYIEINSCGGEKVPAPRHASGFLFKHGKLSGLMTSNHAIPTKEDARADRVYIGREACSAATCGLNEVKELELDPDRLFVTDKTLDYTIIGVKEGSYSKMKFMQLWRRSTINNGAVVHLLSHPEGQKQQRSNGIVVQLEGNNLVYDIEGQQGSAGGALMFMWEKSLWVAALHKAASKEDAHIGTFMWHVIEHFESHNDIPPEFRNDNPIESGNETDTDAERESRAKPPNLWAQAYSWCDLAPAVSFSGQNLKFLRKAKRMSHQKLHDKSFLRVADGGFVDNTSIAYLLQHMESNNWSNPKVICLFQNSSSGIIDWEGGVIANDIAKLFGYQKGYWYGYGVQLQSADVHVFEKHEFKSIWSHENNDVRLNYYRLAAKTVENKQFGIRAGESYDFHIFTSIHRGSGPVPMTKRIWDSYGTTFDETRAGVSKAGGWSHLQKVFNTSNLSVAFSGGGWHTHSALSGWIAGCLDSLHENATVDELFKNVVTVSANSGGTWFLSQLAYSKKFLDRMMNNRDEWIRHGYVQIIGKIFQKYWVKNPHAKQDPCNWDNMLHRLLKKMPSKYEHEAKDPNPEHYKNSCGMYSFRKFLKTYKNDWRRFVYEVVYKPFGMAKEIGRFTLSDIANRNFWCREKELIIVSAVLGGDVLAGKKDYTLYKVLPRDQFFFPLVFKNDGYHTYNHRPRAEYFKRQRMFLSEAYDKVEKFVDTTGKGHCYIIDACVASSSAMAAAASPTVLTMAMKQILKNTLKDSFMPHSDDDDSSDDGKESSGDSDTDLYIVNDKPPDILPAEQEWRRGPVVGLIVATVCVALIYSWYAMRHQNK